MGRLSLLFIFTLYIPAALAQQKVSGFIKDYDTDEPMPFATVRVVDALQGCMTDENGRFELVLPEDADSISMSFVGYTDTVIAIEGIADPLIVSLKPWVNVLNEVVIRPQPASFYIRLCVENYSGSFSSQPFSTLTVFKQTSLERDRKNSKLTTQRAVFKTYYPDYSNAELLNQNQLMLHEKQTEGIDADVEFIEKSIEKKKRVTNLNDSIQEMKNDESAEAAVLKGGPEAELKRAQMIIREAYLDTARLDDFKYWFDEPTVFNGRKLMVIGFKSRGRVDHSAKYEGQIFLDENTYALARVDYTEKMSFSIVLKPILRLMLGFNIKNVVNDYTIQNQYYQGKWYPKEVRADAKGTAEKTHLFSKNDVVHFQNLSVLNIDQINMGQAAEIPEALRYDPLEPSEDQIHNTENVTWNSVSIH